MSIHPGDVKVERRTQRETDASTDLQKHRRTHPHNNHTDSALVRMATNTVVVAVVAFKALSCNFLLFPYVSHQAYVTRLSR